MKFSELAALGEAELLEQLKSSKEELFRLRFQLAIRQLENTAQIGAVKHRIAQIQTALRRLQNVGGTKSA